MGEIADVRYWELGILRFVVWTLEFFGDKL